MKSLYANLDPYLIVLKDLHGEVKKRREIQEKMLSFVKYQHEWKQAMLVKEKKNNVNISRIPVLLESFFAGTPRR